MIERTNTDINVAITYGWNRITYNVLRSLSLRGLKVAVGDISNIAMAKSSKYCFYQFSYPSFYINPKGYVESLKSIFKLINPSVYFPIHEEIFIVAKYIKEFNDINVKVPIHDFQTLKSVHKKDSLCDIAKELNIPIPQTFKPKALSDLKNIWREIGCKGKVVIKSIKSNSAKKVFYATSYEDLLKIYVSLIEEDRSQVSEYPIIQEYVQGEGYGVSMLFNSGKMRARFTHRRLREKNATGGTSTLRVSIKNPIIEDYAEYLLTSLKWHGVAMVEFKFNEKEKRAWLIEINPRFWGSLALSIQAGIDFPYLLYRMATENDIEPVLDYKEGVVVRWVLGDILATLSYIRARRSIRPLIDFFCFRGNKFDDLYKDDLIPFISQGLYYFNKFIKTASLNPTEEALLDVDNI